MPTNRIPQNPDLYDEDGNPKWLDDPSLMPLRMEEAEQAEKEEEQEARLLRIEEKIDTILSKIEDIEKRI